MEQGEIISYIKNSTHSSEEECTPIVEDNNKTQQELFYSKFLLQHHCRVFC